MNIKHLALLFFTLITMSLVAQNELNFGVKAGVNFTGFHTGHGANTDNFGLNIGGITEMELSESFSLQAELLYNKKGGLFHVRNVSVSQFLSIDTKLDYIDLTIQGKFYFIKNLSFDFGPQIGFLINSKGKIVNSQNDNEEEVEFSDTNSIDFALNGGFSYKFNVNFFIQARYSYGLTEIFESARYKNSAISLSLGYFFN